MNYLMLNNKKIELTPEQVKQIENSLNLNKTELKNIPVGKTFKVDDLEFIVLEHKTETTCVILKNFWKTTVFDNSSNDYKESSIRKSLNTDFLKMLSNSVGANNIIEHKVDLTADDGRTEYETCSDYISLLTCEMYRKYVYILDKYKNPNWWWLATPYSTKANGYEKSVRCVDSLGALDFYRCYYDFGVRPFCILKSNIFVSK